MELLILGTKLSSFFSTSNQVINMFKECTFGFLISFKVKATHMLWR